MSEPTGVKTVTVTIEGHTYSLTKGEGNVWAVTVPAPSLSSGSNNNGQGPGIGSEAQDKGFYPVSVTAKDQAGNIISLDSTDSVFGNDLKLKVLEKSVPHVEVQFPSEGAVVSSNHAVTVVCWDEGSGINPSSVTIAGQTAVLEYGEGTEESPCIFRASLDLATRSELKAEATDWDGNSTTATISYIWKADGPALNILCPAEGIITSKSDLILEGTTNESSQNPVTVRITSSSEAGTETYDGIAVDESDGRFAQSIELFEGKNVITVTAEDPAGNVSTVIRTVWLDTTAPIITKIAMSPNPADSGQTLVIEVTAVDE